MDDMLYENGREIERVVAIEYRDDRPFSVMTATNWEHGGKSGISADYYDFEWCKRDAMLYYDGTGSGPMRGFCVSAFSNTDPPPAKLWLKEGIKVTHSWKDGDEPISESELLKMGYLLLTEPIQLDSGWGDSSPNPFDHANADDCIECVECDDWIPEDSMCEHMRWCDECGDWFYVADRSFNDSDGKCNHEHEA